MQETDIKVITFKNRVYGNLSVAAKELCEGKWVSFYDKEDDNFVWRNPKLTPNKDSILIGIDDCFSISINKQTAEIEYFDVEYFVSKFIVDNPEFKPFAKKIVKTNGVMPKGDGSFMGTFQSFIGKFAIQHSELNLGPAFT